MYCLQVGGHLPIHPKSYKTDPWCVVEESTFGEAIVAYRGKWAYITHCAECCNEESSNYFHSINSILDSGMLPLLTRLTQGSMEAKSIQKVHIVTLEVSSKPDKCQTDWSYHCSPISSFLTERVY